MKDEEYSLFHLYTSLNVDHGYDARAAPDDDIMKWYQIVFMTFVLQLMFSVLEQRYRHLDKCTRMAEKTLENRQRMLFCYAGGDFMKLWDEKWWKINHMIVVLEPPSQKRTYVQYVNFWRVTIALHFKKLLDQWESVMVVSTTCLISGRCQLDGFLDLSPPIKKVCVLRNVVLLHENARPDIEAIIQTKLEEMH
ncbi:hypothetical protein NQ318_014622 [Aromia moschata]|uniref:Uncharacterized protein n=1 Tax=Aromia moschata TaxID=1265417 RepID=A0AAV8ZAW6_9CUCU|nr:hypothetical protein NQ318_014622 [Aromia moschata]